MSRPSQQKAARRARRKANGNSGGKAYQGVHARKVDAAGPGRTGTIPKPRGTKAALAERRLLDRFMDALGPKVTRG